MLNIVMEVATLIGVKHVFASSGTFTILFEVAVREARSDARLAAVRIERPVIKRMIALGLSEQRSLSKAARFVDTRLRALTTVLLAVATL